MSEVPTRKFTSEDLSACWPVYQDYYLLQILNGEYDAGDARRDLESLIGSKYDHRTAKEGIKE